MVVVVVPTQPFMSEAETEYVLVTVGLPVTDGPELLLSPGLQV